MPSTSNPPANNATEGLGFKHIADNVLKKRPTADKKFLEACSSFEESVLGFLNAPVKNVWIYVGGFKLYIRKSTRLFNKRYGSYIDIANIEVPEEYRDYGSFSGLVSFLKKEVLSRNYDGVYVECVHEPRLLTWLVFNSFRSDRSDPNCFFWDAKIKMESNHE